MSNKQKITKIENPTMNEARAKEILEQAEKQKQEKLQSVMTQINDIIDQSGTRLGTILTKSSWLQLGERFLNGEEQIILQSNLFIK
jgi:hypothetical protein